MKSNMMKVAGMFVLAWLVLACQVPGQIKSTGVEVTASEALANIIAKSDSVPLSLYPPGFLERLDAFGDMPMSVMNAEFYSGTQESLMLMDGNAFDSGTGIITPLTIPQLSGNETSQTNIDAIIGTVIGSPIVLYKAEVGNNDTGPLAGSYVTIFSNTPSDPSEAIIYYSGGVIVNHPVYLMVRDGSQQPAWYFFDISGWNGIRSLYLSDFWPQAGSITHVALIYIPVLAPWKEKMEATPSRIDYGTPFERQPGKSNLVFVTHGAIPPWQTVEESTAWVDDMTNLYTQYFIANNMTDWQVVGWKWVEKAKFAWPFGPQTSLSHGKDEGEKIGSCIATQEWKHIHFIAHSAGSGLIQRATDMIRSNQNSTTTIHSTFLDPFLGALNGGKSDYGVGTTWSDQYFTRDWLPYTQGLISHAHNVDVTLLDPNKGLVRSYESSSGVVEMCTNTVTLHD
jgi:hypothetical protein